MDDLKVKYSRLISLAQQLNVQNLSITVENNVLHITGAASATDKGKLWNTYNEIDPDMRSGDLVLNITESAESNVYEIKSGDSLSKIAKAYPNMTWQKIYDANRDIIKDPNKIFPGQKIKIPVE